MANQIKNPKRLHSYFTSQYILAAFQKGTYYAGIKVFNGLPALIKELSHNTKQFKLVLKNFLLRHSFYTLDEYFKYKN
jgi:hypothetical protein